jgi:hypothetical protein
MALTKTNVLVTVLLVASLGAVAYLVFQNTLLHTDLDWYRGGEIERRAERDLLMELIPELTRDASKQRLVAIIKKKYPSENVNVLENQVQWRFFHFWFDKNGKLETVQWSS